VSLVNYRAKNHPQQVGKRGADDDVDDRETPPEIFDPLNAEHRFTLDVAASSENAKCRAFYAREQDGLAQSWRSRAVWCNPPYSNLDAWVRKAWLEMSDAHPLRPEVVVMLLPSNRTEQKWWQDHVEPYRDGRTVRCGTALDVEFLPGRPRFFRPSGKVGGPKGDRPPFGCCVLTWSRT
jgi:phage N-6-adenine-methyltransferase